MRSNIVLLAGLAASALALPTDISFDRRGLIAAVGLDLGAILTNVLGGGEERSTSLFSGLSAQGAAALEGGALGCNAGDIHSEARSELKSWLSGSQADKLDKSLRDHLLSWCGSDSLTLSANVLAALSVYIPTCADIAAQEQLYVTIDGIFSSADLESELVISVSARAALDVFISASLDIDANILAGLRVCAAGGAVTSISADIKAALQAWLSRSDCGLDSSLRITVLAWVESRVAGDCGRIGTLPDTALKCVSCGSSITVYVEESGVLGASGMAFLEAFLEADISVDIDVNVRTALEGCARGGLASDLDLDVRVSLAVWLSGSSCSLGSELKSVIFFWLSFAASAEVSVDLVSGLLVDITGFLSETLISTLSVGLRGALGLCAAGESITVLSLDTRAELASFLGGCTGIEIDVTIEIIIIEWLTGCSMPGAPSGPTHTRTAPSGPTTTPCETNTPPPPPPTTTTTPCETNTPPPPPTTTTTPCETNTPPPPPTTTTTPCETNTPPPPPTTTTTPCETNTPPPPPTTTTTPCETNTPPPPPTTTTTPCETNTPPPPPTTTTTPCETNTPPPPPTTTTTPCETNTPPPPPPPTTTTTPCETNTPPPPPPPTTTTTPCETNTPPPTTTPPPVSPPPGTVTITVTSTTTVCECD
ncbi:hypothetical protein N7510_000571 [Penicillium lagena]|uniref:uncharacterized protein n=1 Tax=Penicillium lagena TaxID=94218 RepID=UPI00253F8208|nr:uncharacterized protein N7510_000571 [Penicillium lagena]KAJ5624262.1 hypothetical protein N7510_000571 [Penicillium lagena]